MATTRHFPIRNRRSGLSVTGFRSTNATIIELVRDHAGLPISISRNMKASTGLAISASPRISPAHLPGALRHGAMDSMSSGPLHGQLCLYETSGYGTHPGIYCLLQASRWLTSNGVANTSKIQHLTSEPNLKAPKISVRRR
jgi:hypothetical protein